MNHQTGVEQGRKDAVTEQTNKTDSESETKIALNLPLSDTKKRGWNKRVFRAEVEKARSSISSLDDIRQIWNRIFQKPCPQRILIRTATKVILRSVASAASIPTANAVSVPSAGAVSVPSAGAVSVPTANAVSLAKDLALTLSTTTNVLYRAGCIEDAYSYWVHEIDDTTGIREVMLATGSIPVFQSLQWYHACVCKKPNRDHRQIQLTADDIVQACYDALSRGHVELHDEIYEYIRKWDKSTSPTITLPGPNVPGMTGSRLIDILERVLWRNLNVLDPTCRAARDWIAHLVKHKDAATLGHRTLRSALLDRECRPHLVAQLSSEDIQWIKRAADAAAVPAKHEPEVVVGSFSTSRVTTTSGSSTAVASGSSTTVASGSSTVTTAKVYNGSTATTVTYTADAVMSTDNPAPIPTK